MPVITLSRQFGAGGNAVGRRVAELLQLDFLDSRLCEETARRLQVPQETVRLWDERGEGVILRLMKALQAAQPEALLGAPASERGPGTMSEADRIWWMEQEVIREQARTGRAIIVGRGGAFVLAGWPGVHHFRLVAPREARIRRMCREAAWSAEEAARRIDEADRQRTAFLKRNFNVEPADPLHYALVLNTEVLGLEQTARIISQVATGSNL